MEKAKLTQVQADAIKRHLDAGWSPAKIVSKHTSSGFVWGEKCLQKIDLDSMCRAVYVGIEIIEEDQTVVVTAEMRKHARACREVNMVGLGDEGKDGFLWAEGFDCALRNFGIKL